MATAGESSWVDKLIESGTSLADTYLMLSLDRSGQGAPNSQPQSTGGSTTPAGGVNTNTNTGMNSTLLIGAGVAVLALIVIGGVVLLKR